MIRPHALAFAQARLQERYATRLGEAEWQRLGAVRRFGPYLQELRANVWRDWVAGIAEGSDGHEIEQALRQQFRRSLAEVEAWAPAPFCADSRDSKPGRPVFNRAVTLRETWAKMEKRGQVP